MKNNKKIIVLTTSILLLFVFGMFSLPIVKATETYTEEIEDFSCVDDTYIYSGWNNMPYGNLPLLTVGYDIDYTLDTKYYSAIFKFDLTNKPENPIKAEIIVTFQDYSGYNLILPILIHNNSWNEEMTYEELSNFNEPSEPTILPFSPEYGTLGFGFGFVNVIYSIDIHEYTEQEFLSFALIMLPYSSVSEDISTIYSKEYPIETFRPKIMWTVEHDIVLPQNNEPLVLIIGLSVGVIVGLIVAPVIIVLNKRKSKI